MRPPRRSSAQVATSISSAAGATSHAARSPSAARRDAAAAAVLPLEHSSNVVRQDGRGEHRDAVVDSEPRVSARDHRSPASGDAT